MPTFPTLTLFFFFFFNDTATTEIYTLSLHDALPICSVLAVYENAFSNGQRYGIGGGVTHMGKRLGQARTQAEADAGKAAFELPSYTTAKLVAYWRISPTDRKSVV